MIKFSEEGMSKANIGRKLGILHQRVSQVVNAKEKFPKKLENATSMNTWVIRKWDRLIADMEIVLVIWIEDQTSHKTPLSQSLSQSKILALIHSAKVEGAKEATGEKCEASRKCS